ncbi:serine/threonine-protein kinase [Yinghuangia seranimata]|uniref:serine/threonine-protein kinase n=1 Tax=Yinghuangia seranimata TaxID=408067 RepID=UPI00248CA6AA|nr:serine/threonine-protein kinase [Yinghuangia seranimata]MDI2130532.1 serine/threonine-protein kinase [Yinghuangia seranimata]
MERGEVLGGRYELAKRLGRGGMGEVWAGRDRTLRRDVAVKVLDLAGAASADLAKRFEREAVAAAQINHPNVVALHDFGVHEGAFFLVMEKVEGATLTEHIAGEAPMSLARALAIAEGICVALAAAHQAGVIHYDIKPHNVMLTPDGRVKVVDFGIAGFLDRPTALAPSSQLLPAGTPEYSAPEQFLTERGDERSDLYGLGGVLFAMLTGHPPFTGPNSLAIVRHKIDEDAPSLDRLRPDLPPAVSGLVADLLERDPEHRPRSAHRVHKILTRLREDAAARTQPRRPVEKPPKPRRGFDVAWTRADIVPSALGGRLFVLWIALCAVATAAAITYVARTPGGDGRNPAEGVLALLVFADIANAFFLPMWLLEWALRRRVTGWSLHVGPQHIATRQEGGPERRFVWEHVQRVTIGHLQVTPEFAPSHSYETVQIRLTDDSRRPLHMRPTGWFHPNEDKSLIVEDGGFHACIFGPMSETQWGELTEALVRYGGERWAGVTD